MYHYDHYIWSFEEVYRPILICFALLFLVVGLFYPEKKIEEDEEFHNYVERKKWEKEQEKRKQQDLERQQQLKQAIEKSEQKKDDETPWECLFLLPGVCLPQRKYERQQEEHK